MLVYSALAITIMLSLLSLYVLWQSSGKPQRHRMSAILLAVVLAAFMYLYGTWVFISVYAKYVFAACFAVVFALSFRRRKTVSPRQAGRSRPAVNLLLSAVLGTLIVLYYTGTTGKPYGEIDLTLPFRHGTYFVFQGGKGLPTNVFHYCGRHTVYAMDIIKLNSSGGRASHIFSKNLHDYAIFGDTLYSACDGTILRAESGNPDNIPPLRKRGPTNLNHVLIATPTAYILLGHLEKSSVFVKAGDKVRTGQPLGLVGNSGMSIEPHLHIQAHAKTNPHTPWYHEPQLLIKFSEKKYLLFDEIPAK